MQQGRWNFVARDNDQDSGVVLDDNGYEHFGQAAFAAVCWCQQAVDFEGVDPKQIVIEMISPAGTRTQYRPMVHCDICSKALPMFDYEAQVEHRQTAHPNK